jgi:Leucine rich repeat
VQNAYTCTGTVTADGNMNNFTLVTGNHTAGVNNSDVRAVTISNQELGGGLPTGLNNFFPGLFVLSVSGTNISRILRRDLEPFQSLRLLILFNNGLRILDGDVFVNSSSIEYINLNSNNLRHLGPNLFRPLTNLRTLRLQNNLCIDQYVDNNTTQIVSLLVEASFRCPSTIEQIEQEILGGFNFQLIIGRLDYEISLLQRRVALLENRNFSTV